MKLRNKKTGEAVYVDFQIPLSNNHEELGSYSVTSLEALNRSFEDYKPAEPTRWKPEDGEAYHYICNDGDTYISNWNYFTINQNRFDIGNCFQTKEEAERAAEYLKALAVVRGDATAKFVKGKCNWYVYYDAVYKWLDIVSNFSDIKNGIFGLPYFATEDDARRSIETHRNEWLTIFGIKEEK